MLMMCMILLGICIPCFAIAADDGAKTYSRSCSPCHSAEIRPLDKISMTREQWQESIDIMIEIGADVPKGKMAELLDYLILTHGPTGTAAGVGKK